MAAFIIKLNGTSPLLYIRIPILSVSEKFQFQVGLQLPGSGLSPLIFIPAPLGEAIHQDPGRGHLPPAHKCTEQAIKLTLWQLFSHPFDGPVSAHLLQQGGIKKSSSDVQKIMTQVGGGGVGGLYLNEARLWSQNSINQCWRRAANMAGSLFVSIKRMVYIETSKQQDSVICLQFSQPPSLTRPLHRAGGTRWKRVKEEGG